MNLIPGVEVTAVAAGSSKEKAENFAETHGGTPLIFGMALKQCNHDLPVWRLFSSFYCVVL